MDKEELDPLLLFTFFWTW